MDSDDDFENSNESKDIDNCFFVLSLIFLEIFYGQKI